MDSQVEMTIPAEGSQVALVRAATAAVCAQADFTLDAMEDLKLAVDEACSLVIADAPPGSAMSIRWTIAGRNVGVDVSGASSSGAPLAHNTFAWTVLTALVDAVEATVEQGRQTIRLQAHGVESVSL